MSAVQLTIGLYSVRLIQVLYS